MQISQLREQFFYSAAEKYVSDMLEEYPILQHELDADSSIEEKVAIIRDRLSRLQTDWDKAFIKNGDYYVPFKYQCPLTGTYGNEMRVSKFHYLQVRNYVCSKHLELRGVYPDAKKVHPITCRVLGNWWRCELVKRSSRPRKINLSYLDGHIQSVI